jgi:two-component system phosphate regulon response regulator OmpR
MNEGTCLLVVDPDASMRAMLRDYFGLHGFQVLVASTAAGMHEALAQSAPHAVLLDVGLPGEDGFALARHLRERYELPLIIVTGSADPVDRVVALELGADDCIGKPFDFRELLARVRSVLRRLQRALPGATVAAPPAPRRHPFGRCELDVESHELFEQGKPVAITPMEFELMAAFLANPNRVLTREQLLLRTRHRQGGPYDRAIDIRIGRLRRKVEPEPDRAPRCIRTVRSAGYMFVPQPPAGG